MVGQAGQGNNQGNNHENKARPGNRRLAQWTRDYVRLPGIPDEFIGPDGAPRAVWTRFFDAFATLAPPEIERRFASADRHLREAGVTYRAPAVGSEPFAADHRRRRLAATHRGHRAARRTARDGPERHLWRGQAGRR